MESRRGSAWLVKDNWEGTSQICPQVRNRKLSVERMIRPGLLEGNKSVMSESKEKGKKKEILVDNEWLVKEVEKDEKSHKNKEDHSNKG